MLAQSTGHFGIAAVLALTGVVGAIVASPVMAAIGSANADTGTNAAALIAALRSELGALPPTAAVQDVEASIVYVIGQRRYSAAEIGQALNDLAGAPSISDTLRSAVANVRLALLSRRLRRGTAALSDGGGGFGFTSPIVSIGGGGSSNYAR